MFRLRTPASFKSYPRFSEREIWIALKGPRIGHDLPTRGWSEADLDRRHCWDLDTMDVLRTL